MTRVPSVWSQVDRQRQQHLCRCAHSWWNPLTMKSMNTKPSDWITKCVKKSVCSPSCCVGLMFSISSPLMLTRTISVVQLDRPGSRQVTAVTTITLPLASCQCLFTIHCCLLTSPIHAGDKIQPREAANAIKCTAWLRAMIPGVTPTTSPL